MSIVRRLRAFLPPALLAVGLSLLIAASAAAQSTPTLTGQITDQTGVLDSGRPQIQTALDDLLNRENVQLRVVFVPTGNGTTAQRLAQETFEGNGLGGNDMLLLVAVNDQQYGWWEVDATGLSGARVDSLLTSVMEPRFRAGDYPGGIVDFVTALGRQIDAARAPVSKPTAESPGGVPGNQGSSGGTTSDSDNSAVLTALWTILALIVIGCGVVIVALWFRSWRRDRLSAEERDKRTGDLARQANKLLVDTDDAVNAAQQELGFAEAEFDEVDTKPFADAIGSAQNQLKQAFAVRQQLDDSIPEDQPTKEKMYGEIIAGCHGRECRDRRAGQADSSPAGPREDRSRRAGCAAGDDRDPAGQAARDPGGNEDSVRLCAIGLGGCEGQRRGGRQARPFRRAADREGQGGPEPPLRRIPMPRLTPRAPPRRQRRRPTSFSMPWSRWRRRSKMPAQSWAPRSPRPRRTLRQPGRRLRVRARAARRPGLRLGYRPR